MTRRCELLLDRFSQYLQTKSDLFFLYILLAYFFVSAVRFLSALQFPDPLIMPDELSYKAMAWGYYFHHDFYFLNSYAIGPSINSIPYVLYQWVISPCFYFQEHFYTAAKFFNSLLIHTAVIPVYLIARDFMQRRRAFFCALLTLSLPFFNYNTMFLTENLYIPLFWFCFYFAYKAGISHKSHYHVLTGFLMFLLFLTKVHAVAFYTGLLVTTAVSSYSLWRRHGWPKKAIKNLLLFMLATFILFSGLTVWNHLYKEKSPSPVTLLSRIAGGIMTSLVKSGEGEPIGSKGRLTLKGESDSPPRDKESMTPFKSLLRLAAAHTGAVLFLYLFPVVLSVGVLTGNKKKRKHNDLVFNTLGNAVFLCLMLMTIFWSVGMSAKEHFTRLHGRWYVFSLPFFILVFFIYFDKVRPGRFLKIILAAGFLLMTLFFFLGYKSHYIKMKNTFFIDYPSLNLISRAPLIFWIVLLLVLGYITVRLCFAGKFRLFVFILFFTLYAGAANYFHGKFYLRHSYYRSYLIDSKNLKPFIKGHITDPDSKVALIGPGQIQQTYTAFTFPFHYTRSQTLAPHSEISQTSIPEDTDYLILFDDYRIKISYARKYTKGKWSILDLE